MMGKAALGQLNGWWSYVSTTECHCGIHRVDMSHNSPGTVLQTLHPHCTESSTDSARSGKLKWLWLQKQHAQPNHAERYWYCQHKNLHITNLEFKMTAAAWANHTGSGQSLTGGCHGDL